MGDAAKKVRSALEQYGSDSTPHDSPKTVDHTDAKVDPYSENGRRPEPFSPKGGASVLGPRNLAREMQSPDMLRPPSTDHGTMANMKWSFADSHTRIEEGGWARQTTIRELPTSVELAGVNMRLDEGAIRELHWHKEAEWAYMLEGSARVSALDTEGGSFLDVVNKGDLWYFPAGHPHSLQGLSPGGCEFLLIFDDGNFSEDSTFLLSDWVAHTPKSVLSKNFRLPVEIFDHVPKSEKYIFQGSLPQLASNNESRGTSDAPSGLTPKQSKLQFTHRMLAQKPEECPGGRVRITDTSLFPLSKTVSAAHVEIDPGAIREMHWHPNADEWSFFISGRARVTIFGSSTATRSFDYVAGDVGIVPAQHGHYVENLSDTEPIEMLEIFRSPKFEDFSLEQWLAQTPGRNVGEHLFQENEEVREKFLRQLSPEKTPVKSKL